MLKRLKGAGNPLACITLIDDPNLANQCAEYTTVMFRKTWDGHERYNANEFFKGLDPRSDYAKERATRLGYEFFYGVHFWDTKQLDRTKPIYVKHRNETGFHPLDAYFDLGLMQAADEYGVKVAICGDSVGTPEVYQWEERIPALRYAMQHGHIVTLNQYGNAATPKANVSDPNGIEWYGLRHRKFYAAVPADCRPKLIIGEAGSYDSTEFRGTEAVVNDMRRYNELLQGDPYVIGFCYWTAATWAGYPNASLDVALPEIEALVNEVC